MKTLLTVTAFSSCLLFLAGCSNELKDDGSRGFSDVITIQEDKDNPGTFRCMQDGGGLVISHDPSLKGVERGYFDVYYMENDWQTGNVPYIDNARLVAISQYHVFYPSIEKQVDNSGNTFAPTITRLASGYLDLEFLRENPVFADENGHPTNVKLIYDETQQYPDTLNLQFCYTSGPNGGTQLTTYRDGTTNLSCNLSSLLNKQEWKDSIVVKIDAGVKQERHWLKIKKSDLMLPDFNTLKK